MTIYHFLIFCVVPLLVVNYLAKKPQERFIKLYQEKVNKNDFLYPEEYVRKYRNRPIDQIKDAPQQFKSILKLFYKNYKDKELNNAAQKVKLYFLAQTIIIVLNFFAIVYFIQNS